MAKDIQGKKVVVPGEYIGNVKEYIPGEGTYTANGKIFSLYYGVVMYDKEKKKINVRPIKQPIVPQKNDIILAEITSSGDSIAQAKIYFIIRREDTESKLIPLIPPFSGLIHVSQLGIRTEAISRYIKVSDKIIGRITIDSYPPFGISLAGKDYGVVAARCSNCGTPLTRKNNNLFCPNCHKNNPRKISPLYNFELFEELFRKYKRRVEVIGEVE
ncbi:MAG: exosome complex RNA-binding protein Csl4 [Candidatus Njordarchaeales archaeon]